MTPANDDDDDDANAAAEAAAAAEGVPTAAVGISAAEPNPKGAHRTRPRASLGPGTAK